MKNTMLKTLILSMSLLASTAFAGGTGDGGGDILPENPTNPFEVQRWLDEAKMPVRKVLNHLEYTLSGRLKEKSVPSEIREIYRKLFASQKTIFQSLDEAVWVPLEKGGCEDLGGTEHDASALKDAPNICFAMENLTQKLGTKSGRAKIVALIVHEVSHLSGTSEEEAKLIQEMIQSEVSDSIFSIASAVNSVKEDVEQIVGNLSELKAFASGKKIRSPFCTLLPVTLTELNSLQERNFDYGSSVGISFFRADNAWRISAALLRSINLLTTCPGNYVDMVKTRKAFAGKKAIPLSQYYHVVYDRNEQLAPNETVLSFDMFVEDRPIQYVSGKSKRAILAEIEEMIALIKPIQADVR